MRFTYSAQHHVTRKPRGESHGVLFMSGKCNVAVVRKKLRTSRRKIAGSQAAELLSKAILELAMSIEATDAKLKKISKER